MKIRTLFCTAMAAALLAAAIEPAAAQSFGPRPGEDAYGYYSQYDNNGYYDRDGRYQRRRTAAPAYDDRYDRDRDPRYAAPQSPPPPPPSAYDDRYYREGSGYETNCRRGNQAAGTIFGALAGGLIGSAASRGNGAAVVGGAVLGGLLGNTITRDIDCDDQPVAFRVYADGLNGRIGQRYDWRRGSNYGYFTPRREFRRDGYVCRDFVTTTYRGGRTYTREGSACRWNDGNWHFD